MANSATVSSGGDQIDYVVDTNGDPDNPNLVTRSLYYVNLDADEDTTSDNSLVYDPDTSSAGDESILMLCVRRISGEQIFSVSGQGVYQYSRI